MSDPMTDLLKARARLMLRAERAMGLRSLPIALARPATDVSAPVAPAQRVPVGRAPVVRAPVAPPTPPPPGSHAVPPTTSRPAVAKSSTLFNAPVTDFVMPSEPFDGPVLAREDKMTRLRTLDAEHVSRCTKCRLHESRTHTVFGEGDPDARIMFIGEGPGENEDLQGRPFVGKAGQLLDKMIAAMGLSRERVYICNVVKCRPPNNREPAADEIATCTPYLMQQIETVRPDAIVTLGRPATQFILQSKLSMSKLRGQWQSWRGIPVMPTYHPAYVLRQYTRDTREAVWSDLKQVLQRLGLPLPARGDA